MALSGRTLKTNSMASIVGMPMNISEVVSKCRTYIIRPARLTMVNDRTMASRAIFRRCSRSAPTAGVTPGGGTGATPIVGAMPPVCTAVVGRGGPLALLARR